MKILLILAGIIALLVFAQACAVNEFINGTLTNVTTTVTSFQNGSAVFSPSCQISIYFPNDTPQYLFQPMINTGNLGQVAFNGTPVIVGTHRCNINCSSGSNGGASNCDFVSVVQCSDSIVQNINSSINAKNRIYIQAQIPVVAYTNNNITLSLHFSNDSSYLTSLTSANVSIYKAGNQTPFNETNYTNIKLFYGTLNHTFNMSTTDAGVYVVLVNVNNGTTFGSASYNFRLATAGPYDFSISTPTNARDSVAFTITILNKGETTNLDGTLNTWASSKSDCSEIYYLSSEQILQPAYNTPLILSRTKSIARFNEDTQVYICGSWVYSPVDTALAQDNTLIQGGFPLFMKDGQIYIAEFASSPIKVASIAKNGEGSIDFFGIRIYPAFVLLMILLLITIIAIERNKDKIVSFFEDIQSKITM